jgi:hypothetical protein
MLIQIADVTKRVSRPAGVTFNKGTCIWLYAELVGKEKDPDANPDIEIFLVLEGKPGEKIETFKTDSIIPWDEVYSFAKDDALWAAVRKRVVAGEETPNEAFVVVALKEGLLGQWKLEIVLRDDRFEFVIDRGKGGGDIRAEIDTDAAFRYFDRDFTAS